MNKLIGSFIGLFTLACSGQDFNESDAGIGELKQGFIAAGLGKQFVNGAAQTTIRAPLTTNLNLSQLTEAAGEFMRHIKFTPHYTEGDANGLMVYGIRPNSVLWKNGLRNDGIVRQLNGLPSS